MIKLIDDKKMPYTLKSGDKIIINTQEQQFYFIKKTPYIGSNRLSIRNHKGALSLPFSKSTNPIDLAFLFSTLLGFNDVKLLGEDNNMLRFELI